MDRLLQATAGTAAVTFYADGAVDDPGVVTVTVTREDGTVLYTAASTSGTGANPRTFNLSPTDSAALDVLRLDWVSLTKGTLTTRVEIVGGFLTTLSALRDTPPLNNAVTYGTADLIAGRTLAETALEDAAGVAFVPRYFRMKVDGTGTCDILLPPRPLTITSVVVGASSQSTGTTLTADQVSDLECYDDGRVYNPRGWAEGRRNVHVKGTHGYSSPPPRVGLAVCKLAKRFLVDGVVNDRATSMTNEHGGFTYLLTAGVKDQVFDTPEALAVLAVYGVRF